MQHTSRARQRCTLVWALLPLVLGSLRAGTPRVGAGGYSRVQRGRAGGFSSRVAPARGLHTRTRALVRATALDPEPGSIAAAEPPGDALLPVAAAAEPGGPAAEVIARPDQRSGLRRRVIKRGDFVVHRDVSCYVMLCYIMVPLLPPVNYVEDSWGWWLHATSASGRGALLPLSTSERKISAIFQAVMLCYVMVPLLPP
jgi:hypothetical protein